MCSTTSTATPGKGATDPCALVTKRFLRRCMALLRAACRSGSIWLCEPSTALRFSGWVGRMGWQLRLGSALVQSGRRDRSSAGLLSSESAPRAEIGARPRCETLHIDISYLLVNRASRVDRRAHNLQKSFLLLLPRYRVSFLIPRRGDSKGLPVSNHITLETFALGLPRAYISFAKEMG